MPPLALITGAARGIGLGIARAFLGAGYDVVVADIAFATGEACPADSNPVDAISPSVHDPEDGVNADLAVGGKLEQVACDVADEASVMAAFDAIEARMGRSPDVLVNNAAVQFWGPLLELSLADWESTLRVNLTGTFLMTQHFARRRIAAGGGGAIVNLGSGCNRLAFPDLSSYVASKGGVEMLTKTSALELGAHGIRVNCVAPGAIETERTRAETDGYAERWSPLTPMGRVGTVDDVARVVVSLCGEDMGFVSGETVAVDGGLFARAVWPQEY